MKACIMLIMIFNISSSWVTVQSAFVHLMSLMLIFHVISVCVEQEIEREQVGKREKGGGGRGKPYAHGNLVTLRKKGGLGEVCFLLDLENVSQSPPLFWSLAPSLTLFLSLFVRISIIFVRTRKREIFAQLALVEVILLLEGICCNK